MLSYTLTQQCKKCGLKRLHTCKNVCAARRQVPSLCRCVAKIIGKSRGGDVCPGQKCQALLTFDKTASSESVWTPSVDSTPMESIPWRGIKGNWAACTMLQCFLGIKLLYFFLHLAPSSQPQKDLWQKGGGGSWVRRTSSRHARCY